MGEALGLGGKSGATTEYECAVLSAERVGVGCARTVAEADGAIVAGRGSCVVIVVELGGGEEGQVVAAVLQDRHHRGHRVPVVDDRHVAALHTCRRTYKGQQGEGERRVERLSGGRYRRAQSSSHGDWSLLDI